jgi:rhomboid protease GluP
VESSSKKAAPCPRCGALNGAGFDRCVRCAAPLQALAAGTDALKTSVDGRGLWGTKAIIGLTLLVFAAQLVPLLKAGRYNEILLSGGPPSELLHFGAMPLSWEDALAEPFRLLSAVFVHFGLIHFAMNMFGLASVGRVAEPGVGSSRFVVAYLVSGVFGFAVNLAIDAVFPHRGVTANLTAGASGAVFGAMGLVLGWLIRRRDRRWRAYAIQTAFFAVLVNLMGMSINNGAHLGGLFCGAAFGFYYAGSRPKSLLLANVGAVVGLALTVASLLLAQRAAGWGKRPTRAGVADHAGAPACACVPDEAAAPSLPGIDSTRDDLV